VNLPHRHEKLRASAFTFKFFPTVFGFLQYKSSCQVKGGYLASIQIGFSPQALFQIRSTTMRKSAIALLGLGALTALGFAVAQGKSPIIGLITKTETNPFFVKMKEGAQKQADASGAKFLSAAGKIDGDNAGQVTAIENMVAAGAQTILITPSDSKAIVPAIAKARAAGVMVIALDSPTEPADAVDALFATNNYKAGILIGEYAASVMKGKKAKIAMLDLFPGHPVSALLA
jgi:fructose transport system substrate-binding protein